MPGSSTAGAPRSRRRAMIAPNPRGAIHGTIVATAVIAGTAGHEPPAIILAATAATFLIFWLANVYTEVLAHGLHAARLDLSVDPAMMARELSVLAAPGPVDPVPAAGRA